ncbi:hypothetical protein F5B19DRAFT_123941 [Rostrohypoxylon terebratum]|nr:hypothetical protein F5B19DRAFT_123941 [Rostrohypoxylon terebratum]
MSSAGLTDPLENSSDTWLEETGSYFQYKPLKGNEIRFLELGPGLSSDPIRCRIVHMKYHVLYPYDVLSCDWRRSAESLVPISLNGQTFDVPAEVWAALHNIRSETQRLFLWTDSICVNQRFDSEYQHASNEERNRQILHLPTIYKGACHLLVWLGNAEDNSHLVFDSLEKCREHSHINWCRYSGETAIAFQKLSRRSWFYRTQSAQELLLCDRPTILCGRHRCEWLDLVKGSSFPSTNDYYHPLGGPDGRTHLYHLNQITRAPCIELTKFFLWNRHCRADDPRDKILGALLNTKMQFDTPVNYDQDIPQIFQKFTQKIIETKRNLDVLHWLGTSERIDGLPSWVPDYSIVNPTGTLPRIFAMSAAYSIQYPLSLLSGYAFRPGNILALRGRFVERVTQVADELVTQHTTIPGSEEFNFVISGWENLASTLTNKRFPQTLMDAFSDTLIGKDDADLQIEKDKRPFVRKQRGLSSSVANKFACWRARISEPQVSNEGQQQRWRESLDAHSKWYTRHMEVTCYGRKFFITDKGSMGLAPPRTRNDDSIVFFPGGKYPFILRAKDDGTCELIGDCFLYDLDVFALFQDKEINTQEFLLS